jgi:hypothetical protein
MHNFQRHHTREAMVFRSPEELLLLVGNIFGDTTKLFTEANIASHVCKQLELRAQYRCRTYLLSWLADIHLSSQ